jgi:hypothetical protein
MKKAFALLFILTGLCNYAQVKGRITNPAGKGIPEAVIHIKGTYIGSPANENGYFYIDFKERGDYTFVIRALGYKTKEVKADINRFPHVFYASLEKENLQATTLPADSIVNKAIANRLRNLEKQSKFEADFYSKGTVVVKDVPKEILWQEVGDLGGALDSTRSGILYLSETLSHIKQEKPGKLHEHIIASKTSGEENEYSYNNAEAAEFNFYRNILPFEVNVVSPIADNAFNYYNYTHEGTFKDEGFSIHKIKVSPARETSPAMKGYIYVTRETGELYAVNLSIAGSQVRQALLDTLTIRQNFSYNPKSKMWFKNVQSINFKASLLDVDALGNFIFSYSNYNYNPEFEKLSNEILFVEPEANKRQNEFWYERRPVPLTNWQIADYTKKDSIQWREQTTTYKDSIDRRRNKLTIYGAALGYTYYNTTENWDIHFSGLIRRLGFNTVQAYNTEPSFTFTKYNREKGTYTKIGTTFNYGYAEDRFRATGSVSRKYNSFTDAIITLSGGSSIEQFNAEKPINRIVNTISTLFFRENYMKLYDNNFIRLSYQEEVVNGIYIYGNAEYTRRRAVFNNTDFSTLKDKYKPYTSNNPLLPYDYDTPAFEKHSMYKASIATRITFGQKYRTLPAGKENLPETDFPRLYLKYEKGFASSIDDYNFNHLSARVTYTVSPGNVGEFGTNLRAGKFFDSENIAFTDYRHFNGNQTHIGKSERYLNVFNFLPYYTHSTTNQYFEAHAEHNFKGYLTNKIPLVNKLNYHFVAGCHLLSVPEHKPYMEFTVGLDNLGWGKFRFLRVDYIRSYESGFISDGVIFGLTFLDILE